MSLHRTFQRPYCCTQFLLFKVSSAPFLCQEAITCRTHSGDLIDCNTSWTSGPSKQTGNHIHRYSADVVCGDRGTSGGLCVLTALISCFLLFCSLQTFQGSDSVVWLWSLAWSQWSPGGGYQDYSDWHLATGKMCTHQQIYILCASTVA